jgi:hypothetical protein
MSFTASYALTSMPEQEIDRYVKDELRGQYALLGGRHIVIGKKMRDGRKGRPMRGWAVRALRAVLPSRS